MKFPNKKPIPIVIRPVNEIVYPRSWAIYGKSGSGKSSLASTWPTPLLLLDVKDRGTDSIRDVKGVFVIEVTTFEQFEQIYYNILNDKAYAKYQTIVIDTLTQVQDLLVQEYAASIGKDTGDAAYAWGNLSQKDWQGITGQLKDWIANYRNLDRQVVFLAQERIDQEEGGTTDAVSPSVGPAVSPSVARVLNANVSAILNTFIRRKVVEKEVSGKKSREITATYSLRIGPNPAYITKLRKPRSTRLPPTIDNPTYAEIIDYIEGDN
jgi:hypothetical protein